MVFSDILGGHEIRQNQNKRRQLSVQMMVVTKHKDTFPKIGEKYFL